MHCFGSSIAQSAQRPRRGGGGGGGGLWPPEMGRAGAGFLDSAMKFGYAKREGADVNAEPQ